MTEPKYILALAKELEECLDKLKLVSDTELDMEGKEPRISLSIYLGDYEDAEYFDLSLELGLEVFDKVKKALEARRDELIKLLGGNV